MKLNSLEITNFRSIRGTVQCDLDASVILVYGANGAGKTSIMSAIELGLTGSVSSLVGFGSKYAEHLLHSETDQGRIALSVEDNGIRTSVADLAPGASPNEPLLEKRDRDFLRERAYLAQSTMARLLETYEEADRRGDSALTRFVNELLGLETLDALIAGLEPARDIRRVRKLVPEFADVEEELKLLTERARETRAELARTTRDHLALIAEIRDIGDPSEDSRTIGSTATLLERMQVLNTRFETVRDSQSIDVLDAEAKLNSTNARVELWHSNSSASLHRLFNEAVTFARAEKTLSADPSAAGTSLNTAEGLVTETIKVLNAEVVSDRASRARLTPLSEQISMVRNGLSELNAEIADAAVKSETAGLAEALAALSAYVDGEVCPVCSRDYGELHRGSLSAHITERITQFGVLAERISGLSERRAKQLDRLDELLSEQRHIEARLESREALQELIASVVVGNDLLGRIRGARQSVATVTSDVATRERLEESLSAHRRDAELLGRIRHDLAAIAIDAGFDFRFEKTMPLGEQIEEVRAEVDKLHTQAEFRTRALRDRATRVQALDDRARELNSLRQSESSLRERISRVERQLGAAKARVDAAARLSKSAVELRGNIVEQVFDSTLNGTWRDLFTRLAPEEPYVPEFTANAGPRSTVGLQAVHKLTKTAGPPGLVLSAGNLNTAALTLFLSLNATARTSVDLLLLDDPVQAMDDIHVAQFSALLRSFARDLGRQVVIAIHERSLFEYLSLELAPASHGEALVTIELSRVPGQVTQSQVTRHVYQPDPLEAGISVA